jgi:ABC-type antimicrobial peptide transport system permease subunit
VQASEPASAVMERIRGVVHEVDPALPITSLRPLRDDVAEELSEDRVLARMSGLVALLAALLAATGVISVVSQLVTERTREFGIRTALGASSRDILRQIIVGVAGRSLAGVALGLGLYWEASRWLGTRLYGIGPLDPGTLGMAVAALIATAIVAALVPAVRATRVDPAVALRAE